MPAVPPGADPERRDPVSDRCPATFDGSTDKRCHLRAGHTGLHRWRAPDRAQSFTWG